MYGSELSGIQLSNLGAHLLDRQLARDVPLEDRRCGIGRLESFQSHRTDRAPDASVPLSPLPIRNGRDPNGHRLNSQSDFITSHDRCAQPSHGSGERLRIGRTTTFFARWPPIFQRLSVAPKAMPAAPPFLPMAGGPSHVAGMATLSTIPPA